MKEKEKESVVLTFSNGVEIEVNPWQERKTAKEIKVKEKERSENGEVQEDRAGE